MRCPFWWPLISWPLLEQKEMMTWIRKWMFGKLIINDYNTLACFCRLSYARFTLDHPVQLPYFAVASPSHDRQLVYLVSVASPLRPLFPLASGGMICPATLCHWNPNFLHSGPVPSPSSQRPCQNHVLCQKICNAFVLSKLNFHHPWTNWTMVLFAVLMCIIAWALLLKYKIKLYYL